MCPSPQSSWTLLERAFFFLLRSVVPVHNLLDHEQYILFIIWFTFLYVFKYISDQSMITKCIQLYEQGNCPFQTNHMSMIKAADLCLLLRRIWSVRALGITGKTWACGEPGLQHHGGERSSASLGIMENKGSLPGPGESFEPWLNHGDSLLYSWLLLFMKRLKKEAPQRKFWSLLC